LKWPEEPTLESLGFDELRFQSIEVDRARGLLEGSAAFLDPWIGWLRRNREAAAPIPVGVLVPPDEFQVEDGVWDLLMNGGVARDSDRALTQSWLAERLTHEGMESVDLLPMRLAAPPLADGRRHLDHLRDTHFSARGNAVAAEAFVRLVSRFDLHRVESRRPYGRDRIA